MTRITGSETVQEQLKQIETRKVPFLPKLTIIDLERTHGYTPVLSLQIALNLQEAGKKSSKRNRNLLLDDSNNSIESMSIR